MVIQETGVLRQGKSPVWFILSYQHPKYGASQVVLVVRNPPANVGDFRDVDSRPRSGSSPRGRHDNQVQYACLENPHEQRTWRAVVRRVTKNWTQLKQLSMHAPVYTQHLKCYNKWLWHEQNVIMPWAGARLMEVSSKQSTEIWNVTVIGRKRKEKKTEEQSQKSLEISPNYAKLLRE